MALLAPDIGEVLDRAVAFIDRFVAFTSVHQLHALVLWVAHTHAISAAESTPRLALQSAEKQSGKTRALEVLELLVREPRQVVNMSEAALFRSVDASSPTILWDEVDAIFGPKARDREDLRAMLNAGYRRGARVERIIGEGGKMQVKAFDVFCPVALAGIGQLPDTVQDRAIVIRLRRRRDDEPVEKLRRRRIEPEATELRRELADALGAVTGELADVDPVMPTGMPDRAEDVWEPLLAIADLAAGPWPTRARAAATFLTLEDRDDRASIRVLLLSDIRTVLGADHKIASEALCRRLARLPESPWATWNKGKGLSQRNLAALLADHKIKPVQLWLAGDNVRGYRADAFADAFARYLPNLDTTARADDPLDRTPHSENGSSGPSALAAVPERSADDAPPGPGSIPDDPPSGKAARTASPLEDNNHKGEIPSGSERLADRTHNDELTRAAHEHDTDHALDDHNLFATDDEYARWFARSNAEP